MTILKEFKNGAWTPVVTGTRGPQGIPGPPGAPGRVSVMEYGVKGDGSDDADALEAAFASGQPLIVPKGLKVSVNRRVILVSNLDLQIDGRIERTWTATGSGGAATMFLGGSYASRLSNIKIHGTGSVGAVSLTQGGGVIFNIYCDDLLIKDITVRTWYQGQAFVTIGHRHRYINVTCLDTKALAGCGGLRFCGGDDMMAIGCHIESGDDAIQFVPYEQNKMADGALPCRRGSYIGCTGFSTAGRFMAVVCGGTGATASDTYVEDCSFIDCHGKSSERGVYITVREESAGYINRLTFRDCTVDCSNDNGTNGQALYITEASTNPAAYVNDVIFDNVAVINPTIAALYTVAATNLTINNCYFGKVRNPSGDLMYCAQATDAKITNNTLLPGGSTVVNTTLAISGDRAVIANNQFHVAQGSYGLEIRGGNNVRAYGNYFKNVAGSTTAYAGIRYEGTGIDGWIYENDLADLVNTNGLFSITNGAHVHLFDNKGTPPLNSYAGTSFSPVYDDMRRYTQLTNTAVKNVNLQVETTRNFPIGEWFGITSAGPAAVPAGTASYINVVPAGGVTLTAAPANVLPLQAGESYQFLKTGANTWSILGRAKPPGVRYSEHPEYLLPPSLRVVGTIWFIPSVGHSAVWSGTDWKPMTPANAAQNVACILGNMPYYIDSLFWGGTSAAVGNLGLHPPAGTTSASSIVQTFDSAGRPYFGHTGAAGHMNMPDDPLFDVGATDSFTYLIVKSSPSYVANTSVVSSRAVANAAANPGWGLYTGTTATGIHTARLADGTVQVEATSGVIPTGQITLFIMVRDVGADNLTLHVPGIVPTTTDTTTAPLVSVDALAVIGRLAGAGTGRHAMNHYISAFTKRAIGIAEITALQEYVAKRFV